MHPWIWLNEPQHAAAVQAFTAIIATAATLTAAAFAVFAFLWERRQVAEAHAQTELAKEQTAAVEKQLSLARDTLQDERAARREAALALYEQQVLQYKERQQDEDVSRMRLRIGSNPLRLTDTMNIHLTNYGLSSGLDVRIVDPTLGAGWIARAPILNPGESMPLVIERRQLEEPGIDVVFYGRYRSVWTIRLKFVGTALQEMSVRVQRAYQEPTLPGDAGRVSQL